ncbi:MAG: PEP-CTERM sorting domain-containing protein [Gloeotrichia echinulata HAB0833]
MNILKLGRLSSLAFIVVASSLLFQDQEAKAASIKFGKWTFDPPKITKSSSYAAGSASSSPNTLKAQALTSVTLNPASFGSENATSRISLSNFFTVEPGPGEKAGDKVQGRLVGSLTGNLVGTGFDILELTGSFNTSVSASVDAGFQSFSYSDSNSNSVLLLDASNKKVEPTFNKAGILTIGEQYGFNMELTVSASKVGAYQAYSKFDNTFFATVEAVPEPVTLLGSATAIGIGALLKREVSKKQKNLKNT